MEKHAVTKKNKEKLHMYKVWSGFTSVLVRWSGGYSEPQVKKILKLFKNKMHITLSRTEQNNSSPTV